MRKNDLPTRSNIRAFILSCLAWSLLIAPARGQEHSSPDKSKNPVYLLDEVLVSGKSDGDVLSSAQSAPVSSFVLTRQQLATTQLLDMEHLARNVPSLSVTEGGSRSFNTIFGLRGLVNTQYFSEPSTAVYLDDIPMGRAFTQSSPFHGLNSVVVLRGPQGSIFGQNGEAGVISIQSRPPGNRFEFEETSSYGTYNAQKHTVNAAGPVIRDKLFMGVSGYYDVRDGYLYNQTLGTHPDSREDFGGKIHLRWIPSGNLELSLISMQEHSHDGEQRISSLNGDPFQVAHAADGVTGVNSNTTGLKARYADGDFEIVSVTSYRQWELDPYRVNLGFDANPPFLLSMDLLEQTWSQEFRIASVSDQKKEFSWSAGLFFSEEDSKYQFGRHRPTLGLSDRAINYLEDDVSAAFGRVFVPLADGFRISGGLRLDYRQKSDQSSLWDFSGNPMQADGKTDFLNITPQAGLEYDFDKSLLLYANVAQGFKAGGFVPIPFRNNIGLSRYNTEQVWTMDTGVKKSFFKDRLFANASFFRSWARDYQFERYLSAADYTIVNAPRVNIIGGEAEVIARPFGGLETGLGLGVTEAEFARYSDPSTGVDDQGKRVPYVPEYGINLHAQYRHESGFLTRFETQMVGQTFYDEANTPFLRQADYVLFHGRIGYESKFGGIYLFARNLGDKLYYGYKSGAINAGTIGDPRTVGLEGRINY